MTCEPASAPEAAGRQSRSPCGVLGMRRIRKQSRACGQPLEDGGPGPGGAGIKVLGSGEWQARKHGVQDRRPWRKLRLAMDTPPRRASAPWNLPASSDGDSPVLPELGDQFPEGEEIGTVTAGGAYDTRRCHTAIIDRHATATSGILSNRWRSCPPPDPQERPTVERALPGRRSPLSLGPMARHWLAPDRQTAEIQHRIATMNRFSARGTAEIVRIALT